MKVEQLKDSVVEALETTKAQDITVLDIHEISSFADYMIVATGTSDTHVKAIASNAVRDLAKEGIKTIGEEGASSAEWVLLDFGDVVVHVMRPDIRDFYELEKLWDTDIRKMMSERRQAEAE